MTGLTDIFSTREIALFIWILVFLLLFSFKKGILNSIAGLIKIFFSKRIMRALILMVSYVLITIYLLRYIGFWDNSLTNTAFWFFTVAAVSFFDIHKAKDIGFFKEIIFDSVKWIVIIEFLINFYTFSLWIELLLVPVMIFISVIQASASTDKKYEQVEKLFSTLTTILGLIFLVYVTYETVVEYQKAFTVQNLKSLLHPIIMTVLFLPFAYLLALFVIYQKLFVRVEFLTRDKKIRRRLKWQILLTANLNFSRLNRISKNLNIYDFTPMDITGFVNKIGQREPFQRSYLRSQ